MESLCQFCSTLRFDLLGFHEPVFPTEDDCEDDKYHGPDMAWQRPGKIRLSTILDRKGDCHCCKNVVQLLEDRLRDQDTIPKSLRDLAIADAMLSWTYITEGAFRADHPDWQFTRLQIGFELPKPVVNMLKTKFGIDSSYFDPLGPNVFMVLQPAGNTVRTLMNSILDTPDDCPGALSDGWGQGRLRPRVFDFDTVGYWRAICEFMHERFSDCPCYLGEPKRVTTLSGTTSPDYLQLRVIDVDKQCIVDLRPDRFGFNPRYYALSYVWGSRPFLTLNTANESDLRKEGALSPEKLPDTIADAMFVVDNIGENYLWVDSLCILQDDEADKKRLISRMGTIYQDADVTIVALCGKDAYAGLPGVRKDRPRIQQQKINIRGISMLPVMMITGWAEVYKLGETQWTNRGWTFQETVLSRRRLIFGREQVHFICKSGIYAEDVVGLDFTPFVQTFHHLKLYRPSVLDQVGMVEISLDQKYRNLLNTYTRKQLSKKKDRLDALRGILVDMERLVGPFFQGIPLSSFSNAIVWDREFLWCVSVPEDDEARCQEEKALQIPELPSWSWAGWMFDIRLAKELGDERPENRRLRFYGYTPDEGLRELETYQNKAGRIDWGMTQEWESQDLPFNVPPEEFWSVEHRQILLEDIPVPDHKIPLLCFWTSAATISLRAVGGKYYFKTRTGEDESIELRIFIRPGEVKDIELIVIGAFYSTLPVIAIRWENGIAYREPFGLGVINKETWSNIDGCRWKKIIMS